MTNEMILNALITILIGVIGWWVLTTVQLNRTMARIEQWVKGHEKQDDQRHEENLRRFEDIFEELRELRKGA